MENTENLKSSFGILTLGDQNIIGYNSDRARGIQKLQEEFKDHPFSQLEYVEVVINKLLSLGYRYRNGYTYNKDISPAYGLSTVIVNNSKEITGVKNIYTASIDRFYESVYSNMLALKQSGAPIESLEANYQFVKDSLYRRSTAFYGMRKAVRKTLRIYASVGHLVLGDYYESTYETEEYEDLSNPIISNTQVTELNEINLYDDIIYGVEEKRTGVFLGWTPDKKAIISAASELLNSQDREMYTETLFINRVFITNDFEIPKKKLKVTLKEVSKLLGVSVDDIEFA